MRALGHRIVILVDAIRSERISLGLVTSQTARDFMFTEAAINRILDDPTTRLPANEARQFNQAMFDYLLHVATAHEALAAA